MDDAELGHFSLLEVIGEGGMGRVYKARDNRLERFVAIKLLSGSRRVDEDRRARFVHEAVAASALNHPNIITIHEIGELAERTFIVMELVDGKPLNELIPRKGMQITEAVRVAMQIADALTAAHAAGIVHRDLKPANVMVDVHGRVKVLDFGLAKMFTPAVSYADADESTRTMAMNQPVTEKGFIVGSVPYMSPEQAEGKPVDARSDIFSFGSVLYEMLTGHGAFRGDSKISTLAAIIHTEPRPIGELVKDVPPAIEATIQCCLRKDPASRFQDMEGVKIALCESRSREGATPGVTRAQVIGGPRKKRRWVMAAAILGTVVLLAWGVIWRISHPTSSPIPASRSIRLTSFAGTESSPALSPDGNQVAFVWDGENHDNNDIYVKLIDGGTPLRLTTDPATDDDPAWAPDGRRVAFVRRISGNPAVYTTHGVYIVPALGGPERKIGELRGVWTRLSWSPDGKFIALADSPPDQPSGMFLLSTETSEKRRLTSTPQGYVQDAFPVFSRDGRTMAFARGRTYWTKAIYLLPLTPAGAPAGQARRVTPENFYVSGLDWAPDGRSLVFSASPAGGSERLLRASAQGGLAEPQPIPTEGDLVRWPSVSMGGTRGAYRLAYMAFSYDINIWRVAGPAITTKDATARGASPVEIIASTRVDSAPQISADGKRIAFVSQRSGNNEIWVCEKDGSRPIQLTSMGSYVGSPRWAPDGQRIAFDVFMDGQSDIYVISAEGGAPRRLTFEKSNESRPSWSRDGQWIYFGSNRTGTNQIWKIPAAGGAAVQVTKKGGHEAHESFDGKFLYYAKRNLSPPIPGIFRLSVNGGEEVPVLDRGGVGSWAISPTGIYLYNYTKSKPATIDYYNFDTRKTREIVRFGEQTRIALLDTVMAAAPDDQWILFTQYDGIESDVMMIENFR
jgi:Tol biopolymer transport system component/tRNA A-37 threonylcarbamoyl transferase component Bud32